MNGEEHADGFSKSIDCAFYRDYFFLFSPKKRAQSSTSTLFHVWYAIKRTTHSPLSHITHTRTHTPMDNSGFHIPHSLLWYSRHGSSSDRVLRGLLFGVAIGVAVSIMVCCWLPCLQQRRRPRRVYRLQAGGGGLVGVQQYELSNRRVR